MKNFDYIIVNEKQLNMLMDVRNYPIFASFQTPRNASEVARELNMAANTLHYRVNLLTQAKLLKVIDKTGRRKRYQIISNYFKIKTSLLPILDNNLSLKLSKKMNSFQKRFLLEIDRQVSKLTHDFSSGQTQDFLQFNLLDRPPIFTSFTPVIRFSEIRLTSKQYNAVMKNLIGILESTEKDPANTGKTCSFAVIAFQDEH